MSGNTNAPSADDVLLAIEFEGTNKERVDALKEVRWYIERIRIFIRTFESTPSASELRQKSETLVPKIQSLVEAIKGFPTTHPVPHFLFWDMQQRDELLRNLAALQLMAQHTADADVAQNGRSKNFGWAQRVCAIFACTLICVLTNKLPTTTEGGPLRNAASVLFQIVTGKGHNSVPDLKRACDWAVKACKWHKETDNARQVARSRLKQRQVQTLDDAVPFEYLRNTFVSVSTHALVDCGLAW